MSVDLAKYVAAFYSTWLFRLERLVLRMAGYPSSDAEACALGQGMSQSFAAWTMQARTNDQLLMRDVTGATCSWLMVQPLAGGTRLYFGSGVRLRAKRDGGDACLPWTYRALMGLHLLYSRALLAAVGGRLARERTSAA
ncbi:MAG: hypothetical protein JNM79_04015 [Burkholderiales bacterium]|nr:hypothetical protein [Burkholderiales bacterium]